MAAHEHVHRLAATDRPENYPTRDALIAAQRARCPVCAGHDHTDIRPFGFDPDGQPIPAWWFTCPGTNCDRNTDDVKLLVDEIVRLRAREAELLSFIGEPITLAEFRAAIDRETR